MNKTLRNSMRIGGVAYARWLLAREKEEGEIRTVEYGPAFTPRKMWRNDNPPSYYPTHEEALKAARNLCRNFNGMREQGGLKAHYVEHYNPNGMNSNCLKISVYFSSIEAINRELMFQRIYPKINRLKFNFR